MSAMLSFTSRETVAMLVSRANSHLSPVSCFVSKNPSFFKKIIISGQKGNLLSKPFNVLFIN